MAKQTTDKTATRHDNGEQDSLHGCVLLVEDSVTTAALLTKYLVKKYLLIQAKNGVDALEVIRQNSEIGLVITDVNMPLMSGQQLLVEIRRSKDPRIRQLPVIIMTSADDNAERNLAFLNGASDFVSKPIDELELQARVNVHYNLAKTIRELETSRQALTRQATTDPLTGLKNRRSFFDRCEESIAMSRRYRSDVSIIMVDIDHFKKINDTYGHECGDETLVTIADILKGMARDVDTVARIGGEEFAILLPDTNRLGAAVMAERIRAAVEQKEFVVQGNKPSLTVSIGVANLHAEKTDAIENLMRIADRRLYLAKESGRNRICVNDEGKSSFN